MRKKPVIWTKAEEEKLVQLYEKGYAVKDIATQLNKSFDAAKNKLIMLRKQRKLAPVPSNKWTPEQDAILIQNHNKNISIVETILATGRDRRACLRRLTLLNLRQPKPRRYTIFEKFKTLVEAKKSRAAIVAELEIDNNFYSKLNTRLNGKQPTNQWTKAEEALLVHLAKLQKTAIEASKKLGRSPNAVKTKLQKYNSKNNTAFAFYSNFYNLLWTKEQDELLSQYCHGYYTRKTIALAVNRSVQSVTARLSVLRKIHGTEKYPRVFPNQYKWTKDKDEKLINAVTSGMYINDVSKLMGTATKVWQARLKFLNQLNGTNYTLVRKPLIVTKHVPWTDEETKQLEKLRAEGKTYAVIGAILGRSKNSCISRAATCEAIVKSVVKTPKLKELAIENYSKSLINAVLASKEHKNIVAGMFGLQLREVDFIKEYSKQKQLRYLVKQFCAAQDCWSVAAGTSIYCEHHHKQYFVKQQDYKRGSFVTKQY